MRAVMFALSLCVVFVPAADARPAVEPIARAASVCADYDTQADAQRAADTVDGDGDGVYCESLPCPCLKPGEAGGSKPAPPATKPSCSRPAGVQSISFSGDEVPEHQAPHGDGDDKAGRECWS